mmetsp:Transcript_17000/g.23650  ORF Transcript_17000/g.23650 Transcript_17000/m.23650 type:complete len:117 (-) Transcript_17000:116-466(-)
MYMGESVCRTKQRTRSPRPILRPPNASCSIHTFRDKPQQMAQYSEKDDLIEAFYHFDRDNDGYLTIDELRHIVTNVGNPMAPQDIEAFLAEADNGNGLIDYRGFVERIFAATSELQ